MSNPKTAINEIKKLMVQLGFMTEEATPLSFKLEDDTIINTEKLEVGKSVSKINEAFEAVALEDGSYKLKENFDVETNQARNYFIEGISSNNGNISLDLAYYP